MCDYSLERTASRPAKVDDELITSGFKGTITHGFAAVREPDMAICLLPGTEIAFEQEVRYQGFWSLKYLPQKTAIFRRMNEKQPYTFHDALEFPGGVVIALNTLCEGQRARVLQLPVAAAEAKPTETETQATVAETKATEAAGPGRLLRLSDLSHMR